MATPHFAFTKLVVADLDKSAAFYEAIFGLKPQSRIDATLCGRAISEIIYEPTVKGGGTFILLAFHDTPLPAQGEIIVGFFTPDVDDLTARIMAAGGAILQAPHDAPEHGLRIAIAADPEGHMIEIVNPL